jgi:hypothetical protein
MGLPADENRLMGGSKNVINRAAKYNLNDRFFAVTPQ